MNLRETKGMVLTALGVGTGMLASPKVQGLHPILTKYPFITPIILLLVAIALVGNAKARPFGLGLGAVALVFLVMSIWSKVKGVAVGAPVEGKPTITPTIPGYEYESGIPYDPYYWRGR